MKSFIAKIEMGVMTYHLKEGLFSDLRLPGYVPYDFKGGTYE